MGRRNVLLEIVFSMIMKKLAEKIGAIDKELHIYLLVTLT